MKTLTKKVSVISILLLSLASTMVSAGERRAYPGTECQPYYGSQSADLTYDGSRIFNNSNRNVVISCPLVRGRTTSLAGISASVYGYRNSANSSLIYCSLRNSTHYGSSSGFTSRTSTAAGYYSMYLRLYSTNYGGNHVVVCDLPPYSTVSEISVYEY